MKSYIVAVFIGISALFSLISCKSSHTFEVLSPAKYTLPQNLDTLLIVCCTNGKVYSDTSSMTNPIAIKRITDSESKIPLILCSILHIQMNKDGFIPTKVYKRVLPFDSLASYSRIVCRNTNSKGILALKDVNYQRIIKVVNYSDSFPLATAITDVSGSAYLAFMTPDGTCADMTPIKLNVEWYSDGPNPETAVGRAPSSTETTYSFASVMADSIASELTPVWKTVERYLFVVPSSKFATTAEFIDKAEYDMARRILFHTYDHDRSKNKLRAALGLSLVYEMEGNIDTAAIWCSKAMDIIDSRKSLARSVCRDKEYVNNLFRELQNRKKEIAILDKQMNRK